MPEITLELANTIIDAALQEGRKRKLAPLAVAVLDAGGHIKALARADGASFMRPMMAIAKAWGAIGVGVSSRTLGEMGEQRPMFMNALVQVADQRLLPVPGGVLVRDSDNTIIGAVGISGDVSDQDESCAVAGINEAGLQADAGKPEE
ncbi:MAG: heme-binding protein [Proteobacteria bacterium]|nr:heme-binding protein [Pseudomonadota bacterium]MYB89677.1 heme-binding protein [Pseudomonadota bacterium]